MDLDEKKQKRNQSHKKEKLRNDFGRREEKAKRVCVWLVWMGFSGEGQKTGEREKMREKERKREGKETRKPKTKKEDRGSRENTTHTVKRSNLSGLID